jgi:hypothetical protein
MTVTDTINVRIVILALALLSALSIAGIIYLLATGHDPGDLKTFAAAALGGLTGILATTRTTAAELPEGGGV